ncbi:LamG-like jellyroll fold domain-containing protein [Nonomuraea sp. NPDC049419]|uniref:LamG-like jellyroll fold domain-containing protein n=1 Tax=Nonomuraea sp. NPDC049419 TaxID=3155772 RepID=UPI00342F3524
MAQGTAVLAVLACVVAGEAEAAAAATGPLPGSTTSQVAAPADGAVTETEASEQARSSGRPVEVLSQRGEHHTVRVLPNGRFEVTEHLRPVRTRRDGQWADIDTSLRREGSGLVPAATAVGLRLSGGGQEPLVRMSRAGRELSLSWPGTLPEPVIDGDTAVYQGVLGTDVDLRVRALPDGFSHTLVIRTAAAARDPRLAQLAFTLGTDRLSVDRDAAGVLRARDGTTGEAVFEAPSPVMWDSSRPAARGLTAQAQTQDLSKGPGEGSRTAKVRVGLGGRQLALTPDQELLTSPNTTFPVYIDPVWQTSAAYYWGMVSSGYPDENYPKFNGNATEGVGRCEVAKDGRCVKNQTKRIFYRMKLPSIKGKYIESAEFVAYETAAYDCHNATSVQLWRASALTSGATWNNTKNDWLEHLTSRDVAYCSRAPVEFGGSKLRAHVQSAVNKGYSTITFGLRAYSESSMSWWKRFADDAYLRIQYNGPPHQPNNGSMFASPGTKCVDRGEAQWVNDLSTVYAYLSDPDTEDSKKVQGQFTLHWADKADGSDWGAKWTAPLTPALTSGSRHQIKLPSTIPQKKLIGWGVRAWDGVQWGPWSYDGAQTGCYFYYDPSVPAAPVVSSAEYPGDQSWHGGVGDQGTFTISDPAKAAARYELKLNGALLTTVTTTNGAARQVAVAPSRSGPNLLTVQAFTQAAQNSAPTTYEFWARAGADAAARFTLDEAAGATSVTGQSAGTPAYVRGGATLGGAGQAGTALTLDGTSGHAETNLPVLRTGESFTVSAWVRPTAYGMVNALAQDGAHQSGFQLGIDPSGMPEFKMPSTDTAGDGGGVWHSAKAGTALPLGSWSHVTGVYDQPSAQLRLYVGGQLAGTASGVSAWQAAGALQIGRSKYNDAQVNQWAGGIDEVRLFQRALTDQEAGQLAAGAAPAGEVAYWPMDEQTGAGRVYSAASPVQAALSGGGMLGQDGQDGTALRLDGVTGHAATAGPVVDTTQSFAVSAWVRLETGRLDQHYSVVSQDGVRKSGFYLKYEGGIKKWVFGKAKTDTDESGWYQAVSNVTPAVNAWTHLVGVYDAVTRRLRIYVNGEQGTDSGPLDLVWHAGGPLQIGRSKWLGAYVDQWPGLIDDVRVYDRSLGAVEAEELVTQHPVVKGRWKLNSGGAGEPAGAQNLTLAGGAVIDPGSGFRYVSSAGLLLNGTTAYAETAAPPVRTDDSFTVAGWVRNMGRPQTARTVFSQAGANANAFALRYVPDPADPEAGGWQIQMRNADSTAASALRQAGHSAFSEWDWDHVALVYDALRDRMSLYVNGQLEETSLGVSQEDQVFGFAAANGGLQVGRSRFGGEFWPDAIDDVWAYQGALTQEQVQMLATGGELDTASGP